MACLDPMKLPASSTEEETGKVKLTSRPNTWGQISTVELPLSEIPKAGAVCLSVLSRQRENANTKMMNFR